MGDRNQWSGDAAATAHIPPRDPGKARAAVWVTASYADNAADLMMLLRMLGLDDVDHRQAPA